jgi:Zn-dependent peptidase ImmA (M78 family)
LANVYFESDAERFAHKAWETLKLEPPADLDLVARRLGIEVDRHEFDEQVDGFYTRLPDGTPLAVVNSSYVKPLARQRFTLAHEIGHHLLGTAGGFCLDSVKTAKNRVERACDRFAALLLMPEHLVRQWFDDLAANSENRVAIMADRFGVSVWAMRVRLRELGLPYQKWNRGRRRG